MLHIGIDEAGYGPVLGPLVIGAVAFRIHDPRGGPPEPDLRRRLRGLVVRRPRKRKASWARPVPVPVDDSKAIHGRFGLAGLARGVGAFAAAMGTGAPTDLADLLERFSDRGPDVFRDTPWCAGLADARLPHYPPPGDLAGRFHRRGVAALDLRVRPLPACDLNDGIDRTGNKARVLGMAAGDSLLAMLDRFPEEDAAIVFDRQGGRLDYAGYLADLFPFARIDARPAPRGEAHYDVHLPERRLHVRFATSGDRISLAVGWASMAAKLVRELFMDRLNAYFRDRVPGLRPTAGYTVDGRRFLADVEAVLEGEGIDRGGLVRAR